ncbi:hypothetical protein D9611_011422 [Ephemerocybe angulata]|uniref:GH16 domain-containing protein n=1 Tax=Ephemerocybe angulata TaxID=980116 RepID=A0A8H5FJJ6_9AGAR|nr:hypothetical protein D9611_011422 [Tulosesus angulatus]
MPPFYLAEDAPHRRRAASGDDAAARPPPSAFAFPFQAHAGNPDPGMRIPGQPRRTSLESLAASYYERTDLDLPPPNAPFMGTAAAAPGSPATSSDSLPPSPSSTSLYKSSAGAAAALPRVSSTHSFRAPFLAPPSRPTSSLWSPPPPQAGATPGTPVGKAPHPSTRLTAPLTQSEKPWTAKRQPYTYRSYLLTLACIFLGAAGAAALCFFGYTSVPLLDESRLCSVLDESFSGGALDSNVWNTEIQLGGFGNGEFQITTDDPDNLFIANEQLYLHPSLTSDKVPNILDGNSYTVPRCTLAQTNKTACTATSNAQLGRVINPVMSARINTQGKKSIKYGKVSVRAKLPRGDWLWPAIWMLPEDTQKYGKWPMSGEIDILEARGNAPTYPRQGSNYVRSSLNYGPLPSLYRQLYGWQSQKRSSYDKGFHTYTLEWTERFIRMYVDKRITATLELDHLDTKGKNSKSGGFWSRGKFPKTAQNGSTEVVVENIWEKAGGGHNAPFDQPFYLIINLAAGGTSGWFPDDEGGKPWYDTSLTAMRDFTRDQDNWSKTWPESKDDRAFRIDSVKMWEVCR